MSGAAPQRDPGLTSKGRPRQKRVRTVTGCLLCRQRRVKCDERRPRCTNCTRHPSRVCVYQFPQNDEAGPSTPSESGWAGIQGVPTGQIHSLPSTPGMPPTPTQAPAPAPPPAAVPTSVAIALADRPYLSAAYRDIVVERVLMGMMNAEGRAVDVLNPFGSNTALADSLLSRYPIPERSPLRTIIQCHESLVRHCFTELEHDAESRLVGSTTALLATGLHQKDKQQDLVSNYIAQVRGKRIDQPVTGKLAASAFTLYLSQALSHVPGRWKETLRVGVEWSMARGGPGWVIGVAPPIPGYLGGVLQNVQPLAMAMYSDVTALLVTFASLTDGTLPSLLSVGTRPWLLACRALQVQMAPSMPDLFETLLGTPRIMLPTFATAVSLVARRIGLDGQPDMVKEELEFEVASLRAELEHVWPARLAARQDTRKLQYGGRLWRLGVLIFVMHKAQLFAPASPELRATVGQFIELATEAAADVGDLSGWIWPVLLVACAAHTPAHRRELVAFLPLLKSAINDRVNTAICERILTLVYAHHDGGDVFYHVKDAVDDDPSLDILLL
ncbi:hypothetical protein Q8F55_000950 [Vanrija albida]|uniref:Zn(2)-C6 fungal-type domain-containing protein n=1 Tax=Vanrija albida TaxID=181172 RepID=A0ABR3QES1_9TREE